MRITKPRPFGRGFVLGQKLGATSAEAVGAEDRLAARRSERHHCRLAAVRASGLEHLSWPALAVTTVGCAIATTTTHAGRISATHLGLARRATAATATGIGKTAISVELLLARGEDELLATVGTGERPIGIDQLKTLLLEPDFATFSREIRERSVVVPAPINPVSTGFIPAAP
jgi:hypothetical protein